MRMMRSLTIKEWILGLVLHIYIGGFAYFWGSATNDPYMMIVFAFLATQLISGRMVFNIILKSYNDYIIHNRIVRLLINFIVNIILANVLVSIIRLTYTGDLAEFLWGPVVYGLAYGVLYYIYFLIGLKPLVETIKE